MKIVICNYGYSGYWVACWRELLRRADVQVFTPQTSYPYAQDFLSGLPVKVLSKVEMEDASGIADLVVAEKPDVLVINGWAARSFAALAREPRLKSVRKLLTADTAWDGSPKQWLARFRLFFYVWRFDGMIVGGVRGRRFARWIGFPEKRIYTSIYGYDAAAFGRSRTHWPRRFCFVGRYAPIKGLRTLLAAYARYRARYGAEAWPLDCFGSGELKPDLEATEGVVDHGFIQPWQLPVALENEGAFVFPSLHEPWGVALAEACGSGLPVIVSAAVTSGDDLVEEGVNGFVFPTGDVGALEEALVRMHESGDRLSDMGAASRRKAERFSPGAWADRWMEAINDICR